MKPLNWKAAAFTLGVSLSLCLGSAMAQEDTLLIGPGDQIHVQVYDTPEMDQQPRVTDQGNVPLAFLGNVHVGGLTPSSAATAIEHALEAKQISAR
jgi:polysaccharide export outer membrane protein